MPKRRDRDGTQHAKSKRKMFGLRLSKWSSMSFSVRSMAVMRSDFGMSSVGRSRVVSASGGRPSTLGIVMGIKVTRFGSRFW